MKKKFNVKSLLPVLIYVIFYALMAVLISNNILSRSWQALLLKISYNLVLSVSLCLIVGYLGELSLGHAGFYAIGAYSGCFAATLISGPVALQFIIGLLVGGFVAGVAGFLVSSSILRLKGDYLAIVTLAFGEALRSFLKIVPGFGGTSGLNGLPSFSTRLQSFSAFYAVVGICLFVIVRYTTSRQGRAIMSVRDNAVAAESIGINIKMTKVQAFVVSSLFAGMAGVMLGFFKNSITPNDFTYNTSIEILVMVVLGGMGSIPGAIIATTIITALPELLRGAEQYRLIIYAVALIIMMIVNNNPKMKSIIEQISPKKLLAKVKKSKVKEAE
ncbi:MAG: branched-chain amino acid ABC transporter permease [Oscillospiraceae bacterium]